jgi:hypothetical protein
VTPLTKAPVPSEAVCPDVMGRVVVSKVTVSMVLGVKLEPVIVTVAPAAPVVGFREMAGLPITVNVFAVSIIVGLTEVGMTV